MAEAPITIEDRIKQARENIQKCFMAFHNLLKDKVLDKNKTEAQKNTEKKIVDDLHKAGVALDGLNVGEGILSLAIIGIREHLKTRDRINELEYELYKTKRDLPELVKKVLEKDVKK